MLSAKETAALIEILARSGDSLEASSNAFMRAFVRSDHFRVAAAMCEWQRDAPQLLVVNAMGCRDVKVCAHRAIAVDDPLVPVLKLCTRKEDEGREHCLLGECRESESESESERTHGVPGCPLLCSTPGATHGDCAL